MLKIIFMSPNNKAFLSWTFTLAFLMFCSCFVRWNFLRGFKSDKNIRGYTKNKHLLCSDLSTKAFIKMGVEKRDFFSFFRSQKTVFYIADHMFFRHACECGFIRARGCLSNCWVMCPPWTHFPERTWGMLGMSLRCVLLIEKTDIIRPSKVTQRGQRQSEGLTAWQNIRKINLAPKKKLN